MSSSCRLSVSGASGEPGDEWCSACAIFLMPAKMSSFEEAINIVTLVGNHTSVLQMRVARVSHIQIV
jgi:hypothetical protein